MSDQVNPYQPPGLNEATDVSLWQRLIEIWNPEVRHARRFRVGYAVLQEGIAFFIDPEDPAWLYAASPSSEKTDARMNLITSEVVRVFPSFVARFPVLVDLLRGRSVRVRMISGYGDKQAELLRERALQWDLIAGVLEEE